MKPILIKILIGVAGFAGGFASGYLVHKKMNNIQFEEISQEEMAEIEKLEDKKKDIPDEKKPEENSSEELGAAQELPESPDDIRNALQGKTSYMEADKNTKTAYERLWKATKNYSGEDNANSYPVWKSDMGAEMGSGKYSEKYSGKGTDEAENESPEEDNFDEDFLEQLEQEAVEAGNNFVDPPHQIDLVSFYNDHPEWDSVTIKWFMEDNTWIDESEEIIADIQSYTGIGIKNPFDEEPIDEDPDVRFWANPRYNTNYEFIRQHRSWAEVSGEVN